MLFYVKKSLWLDLGVTFLLGICGYVGIRYYSLPILFSLNMASIGQGILSFVLIMAWTFLVQMGYALIKGSEYAATLTDSLAKEYLGTSLFHAVFGGITAAVGEELFFRGFIQNKWGIAVASIAFGLLISAKKTFVSSVTGPMFTACYSV